jgi:hypothetical protein
LSFFLDGEVPPETFEEIRLHLASCQGCRELLAEIARVDDLMPLCIPPGEVIASLRQKEAIPSETLNRRLQSLVQKARAGEIEAARAEGDRVPGEERSAGEEPGVSDRRKSRRPRRVATPKSRISLRRRRQPAVPIWIPLAAAALILIALGFFALRPDGESAPPRAEIARTTPERPSPPLRKPRIPEIREERPEPILHEAESFYPGEIVAPVRPRIAEDRAPGEHPPPEVEIAAREERTGTDEEAWLGSEPGTPGEGESSRPRIPEVLAGAPFEITAVRGNLLVCRAEEASWQTLSPGKGELRLPSGTRLKAGKKGTYFALKEGLEFCMKPKTEFRIAKQVGVIRGDIAGGELFCEVVPDLPNAQLEIHSSSGSVAVRGTSFNIQVAPEKALLTVLRGKVLARSGGAEQTVAQRQKAELRRNEAPKLSTASNARAVVRWVRPLFPRLCLHMHHNFEVGLDGWNGTLSSANTHGKSQHSIQAMKLTGNKYWGLWIKRRLRPMPLKAKSGMVFRVSYFIEKGSRLLFECYNATQRCHYYYRPRGVRSGVWTTTLFRIEDLKRYNDKKGRQIRPGDVLTSLAFYTAHPGEYFSFMIDDFSIYEKR